MSFLPRSERRLFDSPVVVQPRGVDPPPPPRPIGGGGGDVSHYGSKIFTLPIGNPSLHRMDSNSIVAFPQCATFV